MTAHGVTSTTEDVQLLDEVVTSAMERYHVPGVAIGIVNGDQEMIAGYGVTSVTNPLEVDESTLFQIGSSTKTYTAMVVMRLVERGLIDLDAPVRTYLPDLRLADEQVAANVTMRHLLTHTAGWVGDYFGDFGRGDDALARIVANMVTLPQLTPLGEVWSYNNAGFYVAGRVIEAVTGQTYEAAVRDLVLDPLGMTESFFFPEEVMTYRFAVGHGVEDGQPVVLPPWELPRTVNAAGGLSSGPRDQLRYARFHLGDGTTSDGTRLLSPESMREMQREQAPAGSIAEYIGLPWRINTVGGVKLVGHGGGTMAQASLFEMVPSRHFAITILTNTKGRALLDEVLEWALQHFLGLANPDRVPLELSPDRLQEYAGLYTKHGGDLELSVRDGQLFAQSLPRANFPTPDVPAPPTPPPTPLAFLTEDVIYVPGTPNVSWGGEFLRDDTGRITWVRFGGRIFRRTDS